MKKKRTNRIGNRTIENFSRIHSLMVAGYALVDPGGGHRPMTIQLIEEGVPSPWGASELLSIANYRDTPMGKVEDRSMYLVWADQRSSGGNANLIPYEYFNAAKHIHEHGMVFHQGRIVEIEDTFLYDHVPTARKWINTFAKLLHAEKS